jgi:hypothetical protein
MTLEHYLVTLQEWVEFPDNEELAELVAERSEEVTKFLTQSQLQQIEAETIVPREQLQPTREEYELPTLLLPKGLRAEDMETAPPSIQYDHRARTIYVSFTIQQKPPEGLLENLEDND